ncbi:MAG: hypothetical protein ABW245_04285 [Gaiellaceae bacterium]
MRRLLLAGALSLVLAGSASAEVVAPGVQDGQLAMTRAGKPVVAYVRGTSLAITTRMGVNRWRTTRPASVSRGSTVVALEAGAAGTVALVQSADARRLVLVRQAGPGWAVTQLGGRLPVGTSFGWPGLALEPKNQLPAVAYTRWSRESHKSVLLVSRLDRSGRVRTQQITHEGFPKSHVAPPAAPVFTRGALHVIETYGYEGAVGTIEWGPRAQRRGWSGQFLDSGIGDFPVGPLLTAVGPAGTVYAAWSEALLGTGEYPVLLAANGRTIESDMVLTRAVTTSLAASASGVVVGANEWVAAAQLGLDNGAVTWAGTVASRTTKTELDGWLAGVASRSAGWRDLLLAQPRGLSWFRASPSTAPRIRLTAAEQANGSVQLSGRIRGYTGGRVTIYRERPGSARSLAGAVNPSHDGSFTFTDKRPLRPLLYRAVYAQPKTGVPYAALLRTPVT